MRLSAEIGDNGRGNSCESEAQVSYCLVGAAFADPVRPETKMEAPVPTDVNQRGGAVELDLGCSPSRRIHQPQW